MIELVRLGFLRITLVDLVDIALVAALFYGLYRLFRQTPAFYMLLGLGALLFLASLIELGELAALGWIVRTVLGVWLLAFIVLFQPELRRSLVRMTRSRLFRFLVRTPVLPVVEEVIEAVSEMAEKHIGALIVFAGSQSTKLVVETGVLLQAVVSKELLLSIFNPRSPLHDGAVVIEGQTLVAARCILPLSPTTHVAGQPVGTRHRAALGLSEQIDSLVVVVSEETGHIALAHGGTLEMRLTPSRLRERLGELLGAVEEAGEYAEVSTLR
ncbi:MAG: diadenylate cyclase CdaA [Candidatus Kapabacteria bacterium]|nr:diadenylate cyclase CdaA [Candidatus Kapabacteria bacterium]MCS7170432.1 diadenylate cyclase CdaA [Candidatus Kapabacteria bacterium]MDW7996873.1 diadenylate cyclase CdaA [Bacteroidota bacterium]MDW8225043.1 diadenylate cyclase CdaA [Bacteroidota bacterium]